MLVQQSESQSVSRQSPPLGLVPKAFFQVRRQAQGQPHDLGSPGTGGRNFFGLRRVWVKPIYSESRIQEAMKAKLQRRHGPSLEKAAPSTVRVEGGAQAPLGSRIAARFAGWGLTQDVPELRGEEARTANFEP